MITDISVNTVVAPPSYSGFSQNATEQLRFEFLSLALVRLLLGYAMLFFRLVRRPRLCVPRYLTILRSTF